MKNLTEYIKEAIEIEEAKNEETSVPSSKKFSFNFTDFEGAKETIDALKDLESVETDEEKVTVNVTKDNDADKAFELIQDYVHLRGKDQKRASDEQYAQKVAKCEKTLADWGEYADDLAIDDSSSNEESENKETKEENKEEE